MLPPSSSSSPPPSFRLKPSATKRFLLPPPPYTSPTIYIYVYIYIYIYFIYTVPSLSAVDCPPPSFPRQQPPEAINLKIVVATAFFGPVRLALLARLFPSFLQVQYPTTTWKSARSYYPFLPKEDRLIVSSRSPFRESSSVLRAISIRLLLIMSCNSPRLDSPLWRDLHTLSPSRPIVPATQPANNAACDNADDAYT